MTDQFNESTVEEAALSWFEELGYADRSRPEHGPRRTGGRAGIFGDVVLVGRLREAIERLNPDIPEEAREEAFRKVLRLTRLRSSAPTALSTGCCAMAWRWSIAARTARSRVIVCGWWISTIPTTTTGWW